MHERVKIHTSYPLQPKASPKSADKRPKKEVKKRLKNDQDTLLKFGCSLSCSTPK